MILLLAYCDTVKDILADPRFWVFFGSVVTSSIVLGYWLARGQS